MIKDRSPCMIHSNDMSRYEDFKKKAIADYIDHDRFIRVRDMVLERMERRRFFDAKGVYGDGGFGVLAEKTLHAMLKYYAEPDDNYHEVAMQGFFADICRDGKVTEIQTKQFGNLKKKLGVFLKENEVTVIYPVAVNKWRGYTENKEKRPDSFRLSGHHMNEYFAFEELYRIKEYLPHNGLRVHLYLMDMEEILVKQKKVRGRRRSRSGYERCDDIPLGIRRIIELNEVNDYMQFIPEMQDTEASVEGFTSADFAAGAGIGRNMSSLVLNILDHVDVVQRYGKKGNFYLYKTTY